LWFCILRFSTIRVLEKTQGPWGENSDIADFSWFVRPFLARSFLLGTLCCYLAVFVNFDICTSSNSSSTSATFHMTCAASLCDLSMSARRRLRTRVVAVRCAALHSAVLNKLVDASFRQQSTTIYDQDSLIKLRPSSITLALDELVVYPSGDFGSCVDLAATVLDVSDVGVGGNSVSSHQQFQQQQQRQCSHQPQQ
jgi:hypothetical protein